MHLAHGAERAAKKGLERRKAEASKLERAAKLPRKEKGEEKAREPQFEEAAPAEAEIELYVSGTSPYMELEQQGAYWALAMGASVSWTVTWYVVKLPAGLTPSVGSQPLVDYVQSLIQ